MELKFILESILFSTQEPLSPAALREALVATAEQHEEARPYKKTKVDEITAALEQLALDHEQAARSYRLACVAGNWQFVIQPEFAPWVRGLVGEKQRPSRLSQPALETLAIIAYRQPITRAELEQVRGVAVDGVVQTLLERGLIVQVGRAEVIGRPMTYGTTTAFLEYLGLRSLESLPAADELRRLPILKPESLLTVDPGLATAPPEQLQIVDMQNGQAGETPPPAPEPAAPSTPTPTEPSPPDHEPS